MFTSMKNKIKEETGNDISLKSKTSSTRNSRISINSMTSIEELSIIEHKDAEINALVNQCNVFQGEINEFKKKIESFEAEKQCLENANALLEESLKVAQEQKNLLCDEQDKIQNLQLQEISKLKNLLVFREQEAVDRLGIEKSNQVIIESMKNQLQRLKNIESMLEDSQDDLNQLRHSSQIEKNNLTITLTAVNEENRQLKDKLQMLENTKLNALKNSTDDHIKCLLQERKLLTQRLEEAHLHISDVKSNWSSQNLALETQVSRLSRQVAEETTEKHKSLELSRSYLNEIKLLEENLELMNNDLKERDNKIKLLSEEIEDLSVTLKDARLDKENEINLLKNKIVEEERGRKTEELSKAEFQISNIIENSEKTIVILKNTILSLENKIAELNEEKSDILVKNAELAQCVEIMKQKLRHEEIEMTELHGKITVLENESRENIQNFAEMRKRNEELNQIVYTQMEKLSQIENINIELADKNKVIKILNQRLDDMKKSLQQEIKNSSNNRMAANMNNNNSKSHNTSVKLHSKDSNIAPGNGRNSIIMDEVNFSYLKHVIIKFLTSREVEAKHLVRAVSTLLYLSNEEEKFLRDTLNYKMSWFGSKPNQGVVKR